MITKETAPKPVLTWRQAATAVGLIVLLFLLLFLWRGWRNAAPAQAAPPPTPVAAMVVQPRDVPAELEAIGSLRAVQEVMLAPEVAGRVTAIRFQPGARVGAGTALVQLYDGPERADRAAAVARTDLARFQLERTRELVPTGAESREVLDQRRAEHAQAIAAVRQLDARIAQKRVVAPFSGEIGVRKVNLGQYLNPGDPVASLTALDRLYADFTVPQQQLSHLRVGGSVRLQSDAWPGRSFSARVTTIEPRIGEDSRNVMIQALLPNPGRLLRPGMHVSVALELPAQSGALLVPVTAIQTSASGDSVTVVRGPRARTEGKADIVAVTTGRRIGDSIIVTKGLKAGDVVVTEGQIRVQPGAAVRVSRPASAKKE
ncbi:MAG: efflux RND transporter periplasmic adaptor subunit [Sphingopyxis sp.]|uniref:efflux RND transporter periplasmic adaptor subunit n=1 Tax=Sphingopyxis sp. TaxID=1908224 RepID=UPI002ABACBC3|nr:efflux RND transporter periplasmic adaptor subunit [Sphingopyxis sp.]MDZ3831618.1 efflux RND transporter periplasmic adaptor subunit [Sphingopyxis sp.]